MWRFHTPASRSRVIHSRLPSGGRTTMGKSSARARVAMSATVSVEDVDHLIQIVLELAVGTEGAGIDGHEEVTDVVWVRRALGEPPDGREGGPGQNAPENMHHHREAVPLVAAHVARTAERRDAALRALEDIA